MITQAISSPKRASIASSAATSFHGHTITSSGSPASATDGTSSSGGGPVTGTVPSALTLTGSIQPW